jgi:hypothetical protein
VNAPVQLDGQARFEAVEIDDVVVDRVLAAEFQTQPLVA